MKFKKHALFHQISSVPIFAMFLVMFFLGFLGGDVFFILFGGDFSSDVPFVEMFLRLFGTEMSLEMFW